MIERLIFDIASKYLGGQIAHESGRLTKNLTKSDEALPFSGTRSQNHIFALGTAFEGMQEEENVQAEVEGGEMIETPDGQVSEVKGNKHEQGGVKGLFPEGTKVYSDRVKIGGKTMADRKKGRKEKIANLDKLLKKNPQDKLLQNTAKLEVERTLDEDHKDLQVQGQIGNALEGLDKDFMAVGGIMKSYANGTPPAGIQQVVDTNFKGKNIIPIYSPKKLGPDYVYFLDQDTGDYYFYNSKTKKVGPLNDPGIANVKKVAFDKQGNVLPDFTFKLQTQPPLSNTPITPAFPGYINNPGANKTIPLNAKKAPDNDIEVLTGIMKGLDETEKDPASENDSVYDHMTEGDKLGMAGNALGALGPLAITAFNRGGDTPNINAFQNFGKDAIADIEEAQGMLGRTMDENLRDVRLSSNGQRMRNQNSARSVNQLRGLQLATTGIENKAINDSYANYTSMLGNLIAQEASLENQQDQAFMAGDQQRDLSDRQDRDNFFTQLAQNVASSSEFTQAAGKNLNATQYNKDFLDILPSTNTEGFEYYRDENGNFKMRVSKTTDTEEKDNK